MTSKRSMRAGMIIISNTYLFASMYLSNKRWAKQLMMTLCVCLYAQTHFPPLLNWTVYSSACLLILYTHLYNISIPRGSIHSQEQSKYVRGNTIFQNDHNNNNTPYFSLSFSINNEKNHYLFLDGSIFAGATTVPTSAVFPAFIIYPSPPLD